MKTISILIPTYNEEGNARPIYEAVVNVMKKDLPEYNYEILFIDNKSTDKTRSIIREICKEDKHVKAIFNSKNFGQFNSPYYGIIHTTGDCTIPLCADFQDPVEMIPKFVHEWEKGYKIVIGKKTKSKENPIMYFLRSCYYKLLRKASNIDIIEQFTGFGLYDKSFVETMRDLHDPTPFYRGIVAELGPERKELEYEQQKRKSGKTHNNFSTLFDAAMLSFTSYTKTGIRAMELIGFTVFAISAVSGLACIIIKLCLMKRINMGYAPIIISIYLLGGAIIMMMGFLGEYILSINTRMMNRPLVVEEERINFN